MLNEKVIYRNCSIHNQGGNLHFQELAEIEFIDSPQLCDKSIIKFESLKEIIKIKISQNLAKNPLNCDFTLIPSPDFRSIKITTDELPMS